MEFFDLSDNTLGKICVHKAIRPLHKLLWAEQTVEITDIGKFNVYTFEGNTHIAKFLHDYLSSYYYYYPNPLRVRGQKFRA